MLDTSWGPAFLCSDRGGGEGEYRNLRGEKSRDDYLTTLESAMRDTTSMSVVMFGSHGDDRVALVTQAARRVDASLIPIHAIGTVYAQKIAYGALAFLLTDTVEREELSPMAVMRSIYKHARASEHRPVVVVQYPQLLDEQSRAVLAQMAFSRSILLVILSTRAESLPMEFTAIAGRPGTIEIFVNPLTLDEAHQLLRAEFSAVPTPLATATLWHRCLGNPGLLVALGNDAIATGKLSRREGHLILGTGPWPQGGRVEAVALAQVSMLCDSERKFLQHLATMGSIGLSDLNQEELDRVDHLIDSGFVRRIGTTRNTIALVSEFLEEVLRNEGRAAQPSTPTKGEGNFFAFISGGNAVAGEEAESEASGHETLPWLLSTLRECLLDGELEKAQQTIDRIVTQNLAELSPEMFETMVMVEIILQVVGGHLNKAKPAIESLLAQLDETVASYDRWLLLSMNQLVQETRETSRLDAAPFEDVWGPARWWLTDLLARHQATSGRDDGTTSSHRHGARQREVLEMIVALRNGFPVLRSSEQWNSGRAETKIDAAFQLISSSGIDEDETEKLAGLEVLIEAGFAVFAMPWENHIIDSLPANGKIVAMNLLNRKRKGSMVHSAADGNEPNIENYQILRVLTNREKMVARAAAQGLNNQQIAEGAGVSIRTVEGHLYQIYSKLALGGRRELSALVGSLRIDSSVSE